MAEPEGARTLYLSLLKSCLVDSIYEDDGFHGQSYDETIRNEGKDWPLRAHTMIGRLRLDNLQWCIEQVLVDNIPGDLIETGVWRGGATIFMRGVLKAYGVTDRNVWVADSFAGLPHPDLDKFPQDNLDVFLTQHEPLMVGMEQVKTNFERYGLLDDKVQFLPGWFKDTLPEAPVESLSVLRLDGDLYESTIEALDALYHRVSPGGFVIVDDYGAIDACRSAVTDFREQEQITEPIEKVDWTGVFWRKRRAG